MKKNAKAIAICTLFGILVLWAGLATIIDRYFHVGIGDAFMRVGFWSMLPLLLAAVSRNVLQVNKRDLSK